MKYRYARHWLTLQNKIALFLGLTKTRRVYLPENFRIIDRNILKIGPSQPDS
jgi:hypothetical protein